ncbi:MAG TPA: sigma 54-interacting transcriptional regulator [Vicinamibacterales bacterium]|nr:sigma 54-interacting transcriptional regulator [Vicinamibacterales bacterium]
MESIDTPQGNNGNGAGALAPDLDRDVQCAAAVSAPVLISAEERTGEWLARVIHDRSARAGDAFVVFTPDTTNAAGSLRNLLSGRRQGAETGTVLIKGIDRAPIDVQRELSEAIGQQARVGAVPLRIIAATSVSLLNRVDAGQFDDRLFYRLNTLHIRVAGTDREEPVERISHAHSRHHGGGKLHGLARRREGGAHAAPQRRAVSGVSASERSHALLGECAWTTVSPARMFRAGGE